MVTRLKVLSQWWNGLSCLCWTDTLAMDLASQALHSYTPHHGQEAQEMTR